MALAKRKAVAIMLLVATLALAGGIVTYHLAPGQRNQPEPAPRVDNATADIEKDFSESDAVHRAVEILAARNAAIPGLAEVVLQSLLSWREPAAERQLERLPRSQVYGNIGVLEARFDREKGQWTVRGVIEYGHPAPNPAWEVDWKFVFRYLPSTGDWDTVTAEGGALDSLIGEPRPYRLLDGRVFYLRDVKDPVHCGWRAVGKKNGKGSER
jgi:hypothetical protein